MSRVVNNYTLHGSTWEPGSTEVTDGNGKNNKPKDTPPSPAPQTPAQIEADKKNRHQEFILEGSGEMTIANPHLRSRKAINIYGIGNLFSGEYRITTVVNIIGKEGYSQSLDFRRNAIGVKEPSKKNETSSTGRKETTIIEKSAEKEYYIVKKNDSLWGIAVKFYGDGNKSTLIATANNLNPKARLKIGQKLLIPKR